MRRGKREAKRGAPLLLSVHARRRASSKSLLSPCKHRRTQGIYFCSFFFSFSFVKILTLAFLQLLFFLLHRMERSLYATVPGISTIIQCHSISEEVFGILGDKNIASFYLFSSTICLLTLRAELDSIPTRSR